MERGGLAVVLDGRGKRRLWSGHLEDLKFCTRMKNDVRAVIVRNFVHSVFERIASMVRNCSLSVTPF